MILKKKLSSITYYEYLVPALAIASLIISCVIISYKKYFWNDELYSYYLLADQSFTHMLVAFHDKINNTPFLYFLTGWFWAKAFGSTELSLRLFSSLGICIALIVAWITLRRTYNFVSTLFGVLAVFCTSSIILQQNAEARMYGLFLAVCSFGLLQYDTLNRDLDGASLSNKQRNLFFNTCIHIAIVHTHLFGIFYSGAILFSQLLSDRYFKFFKPKVYLSIVLSWFSLAFYIPSFINQAAAGYPRTWIPIPTFNDLISVLNPSLPSFWGFNILILVILIIGLHFLTSSNQYSYLDQFTPKNRKVEIYLMVFAYSFLVIPVLVWLLSRTIKPIFLDRYMIPTTLSWSILFSFFFSQIILSRIQTSFLSSKKSHSFLKIIFNENILLFLLFLLLLIYPLKDAAHFPREQMPGLNDGKYGYNDLPIVAQFSHDFVKRFFYAPKQNRYFFVLDWEATSDNQSGLFTPQEYKHLDALKRNYPNYFSNHIIQSKNFLATHHRFLVLDYMDYDKKCNLEPTWENFNCPQWLERRILSNSHYKVKNIGEIDDEKTLFLVEDSDIYKKD